MVNVPDSVSSGRVTARPAGRSLILTLPAAAAAVPLWLLAARQQLIATAFVGGVVVFLLWWRVAFTVYARTAAGPDGICDRVVRGERHLPWAEIESVQVRRGAFGRVLKVVRADGNTVTLAAPREGPFTSRRSFDDTAAALWRAAPVEVPVHEHRAAPSWAARAGGVLVTVVLPAGLAVVLAALLDEPWKSPFWPGTHEVSAVPAACAALSGPPATAGPPATVLVPHPNPARPVPPETETRSECEVQGLRKGRTVGLTVRYELSRREPGWDGDASAVAHRAFRAAVQVWSATPWTPVPGLGDEARSTVPISLGDRSRAEVIARRANVIVTVRYTIPGPESDAVAGAERMAGTALGRIDHR